MVIVSRLDVCWMACVHVADQSMEAMDRAAPATWPVWAHLFWRVLPSTLRLSVACQWFLTPLSVRPCNRRAMAVAAKREHRQVSTAGSHSH
jgi:hypothetical protein